MAKLKKIKSELSYHYRNCLVFVIKSTLYEHGTLCSPDKQKLILLVVIFHYVFSDFDGQTTNKVLNPCPMVLYMYMCNDEI